MDGVQAVPDSDDEVLLVPLVEPHRATAGWPYAPIQAGCCICGDAYFYRGELDEQPSCPIGLRFFNG